MSRTLVLTQMLGTHGEKRRMASPHPSPVASCRSHSLPLYTEALLIQHEAICSFSFLFTFHLYQIFPVMQYYLHWVIYQLLLLRRVCHLHGGDDFFFKPGAFGLSIKSMFSFWVSSLPERIRINLSLSSCWVSTNKHERGVEDFCFALHFSFWLQLAFSFPIKSCDGSASSCELKVFHA